jgi:hypothetical protein
MLRICRSAGFASPQVRATTVCRSYRVPCSDSRNHKGMPGWQARPVGSYSTATVSHELSSSGAIREVQCQDVKQVSRVTGYPVSATTRGLERGLPAVPCGARRGQSYTDAEAEVRLLTDAFSCLTIKTMLI